VQRSRPMGSADRDEILGWCDALLAVDDYDDYGPNGMQVPGRRRVRKIVTGVSAHLELIERAIAADADLLAVHHGLFWEFLPRALSEQMAARLRAALAGGLTVAAYHLPLDAHPEVGNNALLCGALGFEPTAGFAAVRGRTIGVVGTAPEPIPVAELNSRVGTLLDREPQVLGAGPDQIRTVGFVSGAGASYVHEAVALGLDALLTGEPAEHVTADAREGGIHFYAAGHHATETLGIRRLGELIADRFGVTAEFIDVPNPV
jgi:dinuclear metal center YbgI/SA1388 family protein